MNRDIKKKNLSEKSLSTYNFVIKIKKESSKKENNFIKKINFVDNIIIEEDQDYPNSINFA